MKIDDHIRRMKRMNRIMIILIVFFTLVSVIFISVIYSNLMEAKRRKEKTEQIKRETRIMQRATKAETDAALNSGRSKSTRSEK